ncbi:hypothetical protein [Phycisphaera mikurensis]|uniref:DUF3467 domain-containing protein n=1 Tax=Phycisphaera mikurensis (strain NBRC 102666 / KCTC 22515 / FYK2301M01) TaxID=1142394 RepID=I0IEH9_PHYMF|nr:hypothetical protein [Phycisphaera mikurensis]MBB6441466.1 hypothetical protein [Phycisphaera mikurensis]BAM03667.1 hypothetical protein PSMK_15080 [Phycisphaera mikurensis NBRC 102666]
MSEQEENQDAEATHGFEGTEPDPSANGVAGSEEPAGQRLRLVQREDGIGRAYVNAFRTHASGEELVVDMGFNLVKLDPNGPDAAEGVAGAVELEWLQRSVMSYRTAKMLTLELTRILRDHERRHGEIATGGREVQ